MNVPLTSLTLVMLTFAMPTAFAADNDYVQQGAAFARHYASSAPSGGLTADGRCGGISYGTHEESCGTATGGPVGGNANRN